MKSASGMAGGRHKKLQEAAKARGDLAHPWTSGLRCQHCAGGLHRVAHPYRGWEVCAVAVPPLGSVVVAPGIPWGNAQLEIRNSWLAVQAWVYLARSVRHAQKSERPRANRRFKRGRSSPARTRYPHGRPLSALLAIRCWNGVVPVVSCNQPTTNDERPTTVSEPSWKI